VAAHVLNMHFGKGKDGVLQLFNAQAAKEQGLRGP
jgi:hypothetical protein